SIQIDPNILVANTDDFGSFREGVESTTASVLDNDTWNAMPLDLEMITFVWTDEENISGIVLNSDGRITVSHSAVAAKYTFRYRICELAFPENCSEGMASLRVSNILDAKDDFFILLIDRGDVSTGTSVLDNDLAPGLVASTA